MKMKITTSYNITLRLLILMVSAITLTSCSDNDDCATLTSLSSSDIQVTENTVSKLTFAWKEVENATQYGYRLLDSNGELVDGGVTTGNTATFTKLADNAAYTFELTAFAKYGDKLYKNADPITLTETTQKIVPLDTPAPTGEVKNEKVTVTWDAVENADKYYVKVIGSDDSEENDTITDTSCTFNGTVGLTYSVSVSANTEAEAYSQSDWGTVKGLVPVKAAKTEVWRVTGSFNETDITGSTMTKTLVAYDDGSYSLLDFVYDGTGYNLDFEVASDGSLNITNGGGLVNGYIPVTCYDNYICYIYPGTGYSSFDATQGQLWYYSYTYNGGYNTFTWNPDDVKVSYVVKGRFIDSTIYGTSDTPSEAERTMIAYKDGSYKIVNYLDGGDGYDFTFTPQTGGSLSIEGSYDYGSYAMVSFYPDYWVYIYPYSGYWGLEIGAETNEFWIQAYYSAYGYLQFKWNTADEVHY